MHREREYSSTSTLFWRTWPIFSLILGWFTVVSGRSESFASLLQSQQTLTPNLEWYLRHRNNRNSDDLDVLNQRFFDVLQTNTFVLPELNVENDYISETLAKIDESLHAPHGYQHTRDLLFEFYDHLNQPSSGINPSTQLAFARLSQRTLLAESGSLMQSELPDTVKLLKIIYQWLPAFNFDRDDDLKLLKLAMKVTYQAKDWLANYVFFRKYFEIQQLDKIYERTELQEPGMGSSPERAIQFIMASGAHEYHKHTRNNLPLVYGLLDREYASELGYLNTAMASLHVAFDPIIKLAVIAMIYTEIESLKQYDLLPASFVLDGENKTIIEWQDGLWHQFQNIRQEAKHSPAWEQFGNEIDGYLDPAHLRIPLFTKLIYLFNVLAPTVVLFLFYKKSTVYLPQFFNENYKLLLGQLAPVAKKYEFAVKKSMFGIELSRDIPCQVSPSNLFNSDQEIAESPHIMSLLPPQITLTDNGVRDALAAWLHDSGLQRCILTVSKENDQRLSVAIFIPVTALPISLKQIDVKRLQIRVVQKSAEFIEAKRTHDAKLLKIEAERSHAASISEFQREISSAEEKLRLSLENKKDYPEQAKKIIGQEHTPHLKQATQILAKFTELAAAIEKFRASDFGSDLLKKVEIASQQQAITVMQQQLFTAHNDTFLQDAWVTCKTAKLSTKMMVNGEMHAVTLAMWQAAWQKFVAVCHIDSTITCRFSQNNIEFSVTVMIPYNSLVVSFPKDFAIQLEKFVHQGLQQRASAQQEQELYAEIVAALSSLPAQAAAIADLLPQRVSDATALASYRRKLDYYQGEIAKYTTLVASGRRQVVVEQYLKIKILPDSLNILQEEISDYTLPTPDLPQRSSSSSATSSTTSEHASIVTLPPDPRSQTAAKRSMPLRAASDIERPMPLRTVSDAENRSLMQRTVSDTDRGSRLAYGYRDDIVAAFAALQQPNTPIFNNNLYALNDMLAQYNMYVQEFAKHNRCSAVYAKAINKARNTLRHSIHRYINEQYDSELLQRLRRFGNLLAGMDMQKQSAQQKASLEVYTNFFTKELDKYKENPIQLALQINNLQETIKFLLAKASKDELNVLPRDRAYYAVISGCMAAIGQVMNELLRDLEPKEFQDFFGNQGLLTIDHFSGMSLTEQKELLSRLSLGSLLRLCRNFRAARGHDLEVDLVMDQSVPADFTPENVEDTVKLDLFHEIRDKARKTKLGDFFAPLHNIAILKQAKATQRELEDSLPGSATKSNA